jgi:large subunit ribosomal protein L1
MDHKGGTMAQAKKAAKSDETKEKQVKHGEIVAEALTPEKAPAAEIQVEKESPAKAGKRSAKSIKETEKKQAKEARKADTSQEKPLKQTAKPVRTKAERAGKKYREAAKLIDKSKTYPLAEALDLAVKSSTTKFDSSVELHINLGVDPRQADQNVRDSVVLPAGTGKNIRVAVADDALLAKLDKEQIDFDVLVTTPEFMPKLGKYARLLGPRGLMPNPKSGTVTTDVETAVNQAKAGKVEYRVDQSGIVHLSIGKVSFGPEKLTQNAQAILASIKAAKPASLKGIYVKSVYVTTTMGPSLKLEV